MKLLRNFFWFALAAYIGVLIYFFSYQRDYIYFPKPLTVAQQSAGIPSGFEELKVTTEDQLSLTGWYAPPASKHDTIIFFHGSGDSIANFAPLAQPYTDAGYGFLLVEYRGYGGMPGKPSETGLYADARAFVGKLFDKGVDMDHIVLMGHSIGAAVAVQMAQEFHPAGLILLAPFTSLMDMASRKHPYLPTSVMLVDRYANDSKIGLMTVPLLLLHGNRDATVPLADGQKLFELARNPKTMDVIDGAGHNDVIEKSELNALTWLDNLDRP